MLEAAHLEQYLKDTDDERSIGDYSIDECLSDGGYATTKHTATRRQKRSGPRSANFQDIEETFLDGYKYESLSLGGQDYSDGTPPPERSSEGPYPTKRAQKYQMDLETQVTDYIYPKESKGIGQRLRKNIKNLNKISKKLQNDIKEKQTRLKEIIKTNANKQQVRIKKAAADILERTESDKVQIDLDKITYCIMFFFLNITSALIFYPRVDFLKNWIIFTITFLSVYRFVYYRSAGYHYYFFDYGYIANILNVIILAFFPSNLELLLICFMHCTGPVALGIIFYKIKIVFHNTKEFGNLMLHAWPFFMFWRLRYFNEDDPESTLPKSSQWQAHIDRFTDSDFIGLVITSSKVYLVWAVPYFLLTFVLLKDRIARKGHQTSFTLWFGRKGLYEAVTLYTGLRAAQVIYITCHAVSSICSLFVAILFLKYHEAYLCGLGKVFSLKK